ncbi:MAG: hypothetical protein F6J93_24680 [Oscillatoria sp. SIO1A7]|nr:hypothetical protein [Oscillatoria sp. SIO1A7]
MFALGIGQKPQDLRKLSISSICRGNPPAILRGDREAIAPIHRLYA